MIRRNRPLPALARRRRWLAVIQWVVCLCFLAVAVTACSAPPAPTEPAKMIKFLTLQRPVGADEVLQARIDVGPLPTDARILVRLDDGSIAGTVSPFGAQARRAGGSYFIPIPARAVLSGKVALHLELEQSGTASIRAPNAKEVRSIALVVVPATH